MFFHRTFDSTLMVVLSKVLPSFQPYFVLNQWDKDYFVLSPFFGSPAYVPTAWQAEPTLQ